MLCIYVEYCVTSRAGKCLETCNTDKPRFDDFAARVVRVRAAGFTGSISSPLCPSEIPRPRLDIADRNSAQRRNSTDARLSSWNCTNFPTDQNFVSFNDHLLHWITSLEIHFGARTFNFFSNGNWYVLFFPRDFYRILSH